MITVLHVVPDERGNWRLFDDVRAAALSRHDSATEAELRAWARVGDEHQIVVHDRYGRTRPAVRYDIEEAEPMLGLA